jgi:hypothetical protein
MLRLRDRALVQNPANSEQFASLQELSANTGLRGGVGRIRTTNQSIMSEVSTSGDRGESKRSDNVRLRSLSIRRYPPGGTSGLR